MVDSALQDQLYAASPYNVIRLELNRDEAGDSGADSRYQRAARFLKDWLRDGYSSPGRSPRALRLPSDVRSRRQNSTHVRGSLRVFDSSRSARERSILTSKHWPAPRLTALPFITPPGSTSVPCSACIPDITEEVHRKLEAGLRDRTPLVATDHLGVENRLWIVTDQETHTVVSGLMAAKPVFIADGHHRYETALKYRDEVAASRPVIRSR